MDKQFPEGIRYYMPKDNAPDFIKGNISINVDQFTNYLQKHKNDKGYVNLDLKKSKSGKLHFDLNDWKPNKSEQQKNVENVFQHDIPF